MEQDRLIEEWTDNLIPSGQNWDEEIKRRLEEADLFVALVTTPFLASGYINKTERPIAMERHKAGKLKLAWVIVEPECAWKAQDFSALQVIQPGGRAVRQWGRLQDAFNAVEKTLRGDGGAVTTPKQRIYSPPSAPPPPAPCRKSA